MFGVFSGVTKQFQGDMSQTNFESQNSNLMSIFKFIFHVLTIWVILPFSPCPKKRCHTLTYSFYTRSSIYAWFDSYARFSIKNAAFCMLSHVSSLRSFLVRMNNRRYPFFWSINHNLNSYNIMNFFGIKLC